VPFGSTRQSLHFHGISMLLWLTLLIVQPWLIRTGKKRLHRLFGRASLLLIPVLVVSGTVIVFEDFSHNYPDPYEADALGVLFVGFGFLVPLLLFYSLAIINRKNVHLHARYMLATSVFLIIPGFFRLYMMLLQPDEFGGPFFYSMLAVSIIPIALLVNDKIKGKIYPPFIYLAIAWAINLAGFKFVHHLDSWHSFATWSLALGF
jgi:hypothetical protein